MVSRKDTVSVDVEIPEDTWRVVFSKAAKRSGSKFAASLFFAINDHISKVWDDASNVVFGALLSAYLGVKLATLDVSTMNILALIGLCLFHTVFLWSLLFSREIRSLQKVKVPGTEFDLNNEVETPKSLSILLGVLPLAALAGAGWCWSLLFEELAIYSAIVAAWLISTFVLRYLMKRVGGSWQRNVDAQFHRAIREGLKRFEAMDNDELETTLKHLKKAEEADD